MGSSYDEFNNRLTKDYKMNIVTTTTRKSTKIDTSHATQASSPQGVTRQESNPRKQTVDAFSKGEPIPKTYTGPQLTKEALLGDIPEFTPLARKSLAVGAVTTGLVLAGAATIPFNPVLGVVMFLGGAATAKAGAYLAEKNGNVRNPEKPLHEQVAICSYTAGLLSTAAVGVIVSQLL